MPMIVNNCLSCFPDSPSTTSPSTTSTSTTDSPTSIASTTGIIFQKMNKYVLNGLFPYSFFIALLYFTILALESFFVGNQGQHDCPGGAFIRDQTMCKKACNQLVLPLREIIGGFVCYKDYRGYCFQNGQNGGGASMVCMQIP